MKKKLFIIYVTLIIIATLTTGILFTIFVGKNYKDNLIDKLSGKAEIINQYMLLKQERNENIIYYKLASEYAKKEGVRVTFLNKNGEVLADSKNNSIIFKDNITRPEVIQAIDGHIGVVRRKSIDDNKEMFFVAVCAVKIKNDYIITRVGEYTDSTNCLNKVFYINVIYSIIIGIIAALLIGYKYIDNITKPIKELTNISKAIANGQFDKTVKVCTKDEIEELANNFNFMANKLKHMVEELKNSNVTMHSILSSISDGILAVDKKYNIIFANDCTKKLFNIENDNLKGTLVKNLITNTEILKAIKETFDNGSFKNKEILINDSRDKIIKINSNLIREDNSSNTLGVIMVIEDITEMKKLENMRTEFVSNASHELKTPLTIISGFLETLRFGNVDNEESKCRFLHIINEETQRLIRLVEDLLTLSRLENINLEVKHEKEEIKVNEVIEEMQYIFQKRLKEKSIQLKIQIENSITIYLCNKDWFKQMIFNLVENAIKYNLPNGEIILKAYVKENYLYVLVKDTGRGINEEDINRIFERFYRVHKGRARMNGGTGLGLAIVKHIVRSFNGSIEVESQIGVGSKFIIKLPEY